MLPLLTGSPPSPPVKMKAFLRQRQNENEWGTRMKVIRTGDYLCPGWSKFEARDSFEKPYSLRMSIFSILSWSPMRHYRFAETKKMKSESFVLHPPLRFDGEKVGDDFKEADSEGGGLNQRKTSAATFLCGAK